VMDCESARIGKLVLVSLRQGAWRVQSRRRVYEYFPQNMIVLGRTKLCGNQLVENSCSRMWHACMLGDLDRGSFLILDTYWSIPVLTRKIKGKGKVGLSTTP
jgi:hypothetical protein